jgi:hypothetical protein
MMRETERFVDQVIRKGDGKLETLFTAPYSFVDDPLLAKLYGVSPGNDPTKPVTLDPKQRAGLLTQASVMSSHADGDRTSPIKRGVLVLRLACVDLAPPANGVNPLDAGASTAPTSKRDELAAHRANPACAGCHDMIDPPGLAFETYDAIGAFRTKENGQDIDVSGVLSGIGADGPFVGAPELARKLAGSEKVRNCMAKQWFRFALARMESAADTCSIDTLASRFKESGYDVRELILDLASLHSFRYQGNEP